ncbi:MAG: Hsp70 family protein [Bacteroidales bacterium]|nr:Hsp70 family protein [Bacteroidales bacterium]
MGICVGIDLGTTFSAVARIDPNTGKPMIIKNSFGSTTTPSVLCFERDGNILFGEDAKNMQSVGDTNAIAFFKRSMGKDMFSVDILGKNYSATDLSAIFLQKLKEEAEQQSGEKIESAVITVPAYFTHRERAATIEAGKRAGLKVNAIINEPTAAAFAYGLNDKKEEQTVLIYDLGGGTFDVALTRINKNEISVLGSDGDHELGGKDWDDCIARYLANEFFEKYGVDLCEEPEMVASLLVTAENVKKQLTSKDMVSVPIAYQDIRETIDITEETFESISQFLIGTTKDVTERLMDSVEIDWNQIDGVILVGGSTRMRMIHNYVYEMSGKPPLSGVNVDEAVALGAAIRANITDKGETIATIGGFFGKTKSSGLSIQGAKAVTDVTAHSLGMISISPDSEEYINSIIIKKNTKIPASNTKPFNLKTRAKDNELEVYVLQGEYKRPLDNTIINKYVISKIERTSPPNSVIEVTYKYTANGVIEVSAVQKETNKKLPIKIEPVPEDMSWTDISPKGNMASGEMPSVDVMLAIDLSGSMSGNPTRKAMKAMADFINQMDSDYTRIGIMAFADDTKVILKPSDDFKVVHNTISRLESVNVGICNNAEPFTYCYGILKGGFLKKESDIKYIVVLTDGRWSNTSNAIKAAKKCHKAGIEVMALGFGSADHEFLKKIASTDEFASITDLSDLGGSFSKIAQAIGEGSTGLSVL